MSKRGGKFDENQLNYIIMKKLAFLFSILISSSAFAQGNLDVDNSTGGNILVIAYYGTTCGTVSGHVTTCIYGSSYTFTDPGVAGTQCLYALITDIDASCQPSCHNTFETSPIPCTPIPASGQWTNSGGCTPFGGATWNSGTHLVVF